MRISDWNSDVCSSDLLVEDHICDRYALGRDVGDLDTRAVSGQVFKEIGTRLCPKTFGVPAAVDGEYRHVGRRIDERNCVVHRPSRFSAAIPCDQHIFADRLTAPRSEEHTSELQSLMRISYAVFGLKKKS